jgi:hypothetical protein
LQGYRPHCRSTRQNRLLENRPKAAQSRPLRIVHGRLIMAVWPRPTSCFSA